MTFDPNQHATEINTPESQQRAPRPPSEPATSLNGMTIEPLSSLSVAERIQRARERGIELSKRTNAHPTFSFNHDLAYWQDVAGPGTSEYDAEVLLSQLSLLQEPRFINWRETRWVNSGGFYNRRTATWVSDKSIVPIEEIRGAVDARIKELGLDAGLVAEHYAVAHSIAEHREFLNLSFEERMQRFRSPATKETP